MSDFFDKALHYLGKKSTKNNSEIFALNIGSMDAIMFDELCGYAAMYNFKGLYVEPIPYLFEKLKANIKNNGNKFENSAISDYDGQIEMIMIDKYAIDSGKVHNCFYGMSAVYPPRNGLGSEGDKQTVEKYGKMITVPCITFETLMAKHNIENFDIVKIDTEGHDYVIFKQINLDKYKPKVIRLEWINISEEEQKNIIDTFNKHDYVFEIISQDITALPRSFLNEIESTNNDIIVNNNKNNDNKNNNNNNNQPVITLVTGLWNIGRSELSTGWSRSFQNYLDQFMKLLEVNTNMIIYGDDELEKFVWERRNPHNTQFINRNIEWFKNNEYFNLIQKIRADPNWYEQAGWLKHSTQAKLEMYNPLVMSKMFLLNDAQILDKFNSDFMFWIDAGLTFTVHPGYFTHDKVLPKLPKYISKFTFITFPYETITEIHGFKYKKLCNYANDDQVDKVARGGFFGGPKNTISQINSVYYNLLIDTLHNNLMGTEESLFTIILFKYPELVNYVAIESNGLLCKLFEDLKNNNVIVKSMNFNNNYTLMNKSLSDLVIHLYVLTYNFPEQLELLLNSFYSSDKNFILKPKKFLINNSTDRSTDEKYDVLCRRYNFVQIRKDNIGICGGRQFAAEHFNNSDADYYIFFEDDMLLYNETNKNEFCKSGFRKWVPNLYEKTLQIMMKENYDFLKLSFTEVYGDNSVQWSWYNVPDHIRIKYFPNKTKKPEFGLDPNPPLTNLTNIKKYDDIMFIEGDIYYCNWPLWFNKEGNKKVFLEPTFAHPFEQTWMSHVFQEQKQKTIHSCVLLLSPINHNRILYYKSEDRREN
jgi:FkbM family methyltransferase